ncbi:MAG: glycosyltransferase family 39 protein [Gemmatimonadota bacterium]|nr:glycosyltransferase family 39 protein [Gemmatimonadota bacterium]
MRVGRIAIALIAAATLLRIALAVAIPLFPDEAYYWDWSRHLAAGYFDHPPAVAVLIRAGATLFGDTTLGVRAGSLLAGVVASLAITVTSVHLSVRGRARATGAASVLDDPASRAALLLLVIPGALAGFVIATPDTALLASAALTLASLERAVAATRGSRAALGWWCAAGLILGIAFCSKYTAVLIPLGVLIAFLSRRELRALLAEPGPYLATLIALVVFAPNLVWNAHHDWVSFAFQINHGLGGAHGSAIAREIALVGGQIGIISPILAVFAVVAVIRSLRGVTDSRRYMLAVVAATIVVFFAMSAVRRPVEPNWPVLALVAALPLMATVDLNGRARAWFVGGSVLGAVLTLVVAAQGIGRVFHVPPRRDPISRAFGWADVAHVVTRADATARGCSAVWIAADRYQDAAELAFTLPSRPRVFALNLGGRPNQYDLWPSLYSEAAPTDCALLVVDEGPDGTSIVRKFGAESASIIGDAVMSWRGAVVGRRVVWLLRGIPAARPAEIVLTPQATAALSSTAAIFQPRAKILDSIVAVFRHGPAPDVVTSTGATPLANADRHLAIDARIKQLHTMLHRSGFHAVYRDARYPDCTFVRTSELDSTDIGYVNAAEGCRLSTGRDDALLRLERAHDAWYAYASPERRRY